MPVLPEVASSRILSCVSAPLRSPSAIIRAAGRSLTEPPGFFHSAFAYSSTLRRPASKPDSRISGVFPIKSTTEAAVRGSPGVATDISDCFSRKLYLTPNAARPNSQKEVSNYGAGEDSEEGVSSSRVLVPVFGAGRLRDRNIPAPDRHAFECPAQAADPHPESGEPHRPIPGRTPVAA